MTDDGRSYERPDECPTPSQSGYSVDSYGRLLRYVARVHGHLNVNIHLVAVGAAAP